MHIVNVQLSAEPVKVARMSAQNRLEERLAQRVGISFPPSKKLAINSPRCALLLKAGTVYLSLIRAIIAQKEFTEASNLSFPAGS